MLFFIPMVRVLKDHARQLNLAEKCLEIYQRHKLEDKGFPVWYTERLLDFSNEVIPTIANVDILNSDLTPSSFRYSFFGTFLVNYFGEDLTGKILSELKNDDFRNYTNLQLKEVINSQAPKIFQKQIKIPGRLETIHIALRLPYFKEGEVNKVVSISQFGEHSDGLSTYLLGREPSKSQYPTVNELMGSHF